jgi:hypothetical protein
MMPRPADKLAGGGKDKVKTLFNLGCEYLKVTND